MLSTRSAAAALVILSLASTGLLVVGLFNYFNYSNPYSYVPVGPVTLIDTDINPKANYTLVFVLDGVRADVFYTIAKPNIDSFGGWANLTNVQCSTLLSVSRAGYGVIPSGVNTSESQVIANEHIGPFPADSLWKSTLRHGGTTAFVGSETWHELFGDWMNYSITFSEGIPGRATLVVNTTSGSDPIEEELPAYSDALVSDYSIELVNTRTPTFTVVHFGETDEIGHENGSLSELYREALERQETYIGEILDAYEALGILNSTLIIVTSDHGQTDFQGKGGEHGGIESDILHTPLLIRGPRVIPGVYTELHHQTSIAPTIASVMGWEIPYDASGSILFESLDFSNREEAVYRINQAALRLEQAVVRAQMMGYAGSLAESIDIASSQLIQAESYFTSGFYEQATDIAKASEALSDSILRISWYSKINEESTFRFAVLILFLG
ncbi:MAG: alkaline phosphatase family protein, partial [Candidatus Odinarchaeota archaeon]